MAVYQQPSTRIVQYDPSFILQTYLHEKLLPQVQNHKEIAIKMYAYFTQLELLVTEFLAKGQCNELYRVRIDIVLNQMSNILAPLKTTPAAYLSECRMNDIFPASQKYLSTGVTTRTDLSRTDAVDGLAIVNRLVEMARQIHSTIDGGASHKYMAHQMALFYQTLQPLTGHYPRLKSEIEANFEPIKEAISGDNETLNSTQIVWLLRVTSEIINRGTEHIPPKLEKLIHHLATILPCD